QLSLPPSPSTPTTPHRPYTLSLHDALPISAGLRFDELPWWHEEPTPEDLELARGALLPLCQVNVWTRTYQTHPCEVTQFSLDTRDRKSTRLNSSHRTISYAVFCLKKKKKTI